ncbi:MAG: sodium-dependent transporter [Gammaproteobacteria bacterium]|nr:sodium-dependent transporter [Gammaproteobacteria bacterium]
MSEQVTERSDMWSNSYIFVLAAAGSAVGLGNIWKFPYIAGENGGGAFVLVYLICIAVIGIPVMASEIMLGKLGRASPIQALLNLTRKHNRSTNWSIVGYMGVVTGFLILSFYAVIAGWVCYYIVRLFSGEFTGADANAVGEAFGAFLADPMQVLLWFSIFMVITIFFVARGVTRGLELCVRYSMPAVFVLLLILIGYGIHAGGFIESMAFLFTPDFSSLSPQAILIALGHAFFTLSLGMGAIMAYGAYVPQDVSVGTTTFTIAILDTVLALLAGLAIFAIVFAYGLVPGAGPGLLFETVPIAFGNLPGGALFGGLFFLLVALAALTSAISISEPVIAYVSERSRLTRAQIAVIIGVVCWVLGVGSVLSFNVWSDVKLAFFEWTFFDSLDKLTQLVLLPLGGMLIALIVGHVLPKAVVYEELGLIREKAQQSWSYIVGYVTPIAVFAVFIIEAIREIQAHL